MSRAAHRRVTRCALLLVLWLAGTPFAPAWAHKASDAFVSISEQGPGLGILWEIAVRDLGLRLDLDIDRDQSLNAQEIAAGRPAIDALALGAITLARGAQPCLLAVDGHDFTRRQDEVMVRLSMRATCSDAIEPLTIDYRLFRDTDASHRGLLIVAGSLAPLVLVPGSGAQPIPARPAENARAAQAWAFFVEGVHHILSGFDHLAFLMALLLPAALMRRDGQWVARSDRRHAALEVAGLVTAFTLAHSITLVLGATGVVTVPPAPVELAIAASVTLAAVNNVRPLLSRRLWLVVFAFGLVHGFGFASSLADTGLPAQGRLPALLAFNLGVEAGQLLVVTAVAPLLWLTRELASYRRIAMPLASLALAGAGLMWIVQRAGAFA